MASGLLTRLELARQPMKSTEATAAPGRSHAAADIAPGSAAD
jgi:hypothetical protein